MRNFLPPQTAEPEIFLLEQDGVYNGTYGAKNGKPRKLSQLTNFDIIMINAWLWLYRQPHSSILASSICTKVLVIAATKSDMLAEVARLKVENKEGMEKQDDLMSSAKVLQRRITRQSKVMKCDFICFPIIPGPQRERKVGIEYKEISTFSEQKK